MRLSKMPTWIIFVCLFVLFCVLLLSFLLVVISQSLGVKRCLSHGDPSTTLRPIVWNPHSQSSYKCEDFSGYRPHRSGSSGTHLWPLTKVPWLQASCVVAPPLPTSHPWLCALLSGLLSCFPACCRCLSLGIPDPHLSPISDKHIQEHFYSHRWLWRTDTMRSFLEYSIWEGEGNHDPPKACKQTCWNMVHLKECCLNWTQIKTKALDLLFFFF